MKKKQILSLIIPLLVLLSILGGLFLFQRPSSPEESSHPYAFSSSPQPWSQAGDFLLETKAAGTVIKNTKISFSCQLPLNWQAEIRKIKDQEWAVDIRSPQAIFDANQFIQEGCWLNLETVQSGELNSLLEEEIRQLLESANLLSSEPVFNTPQGEKHQVLLTGSYYPALEESSPWINGRQLISLYLPLEKGQIIKWEGQFSLSDQENCQQSLEAILATLEIN